MPVIDAKYTISNQSCPCTQDAVDICSRGDGEYRTIQRNIGMFALSDSGNYFTACNSSPGTATQTGFYLSYSDTAALVLIKNNNSYRNGRRIYVSDLKLLLGGVAPPSGTVTRVELAVKVDVRENARYPTNGTLMTIQNLENNSVASGALVWSPTSTLAMSVPASSSMARLVARAGIAVSNVKLGDEYIFKFGGNGSLLGYQGQEAIRADPSTLTTNTTPVIIAPQQFCVFNVWLPGSTAVDAARWEYQVSWWEA
jgi:outer membrane protein assembly factor BamA